MLQTDVLQNIDHCETVAGGSNHRFLRGLWDIWRGVCKVFFTIKEQAKIKHPVLPPLIYTINAKRLVWFMIICGSDEFAKLD